MSSRGTRQIGYGNQMSSAGIMQSKFSKSKCWVCYNIKLNSVCYHIFLNTLIALAKTFVGG